ncbi:unnamed protein product [Cuscuta epithymum]|nr:unnamed protein product [Cuscuta epithymum]
MVGGSLPTSPTPVLETERETEEAIIQVTTAGELPPRPPAALEIEDTLRETTPLTRDDDVTSERMIATRNLPTILLFCYLISPTVVLIVCLIFKVQDISWRIIIAGCCEYIGLILFVVCLTCLYIKKLRT